MPRRQRQRQDRPPRPLKLVAMRGSGPLGQCSLSSGLAVAATVPAWRPDHRVAPSREWLCSRWRRTGFCWPWTPSLGGVGLRSPASGLSRNAPRAGAALPPTPGSGQSKRRCLRSAVQSRQAQRAMSPASAACLRLVNAPVATNVPLVQVASNVNAASVGVAAAGEDRFGLTPAFAGRLVTSAGAGGGLALADALPEVPPHSALERPRAPTRLLGCRWVPVLAQGGVAARPQCPCPAGFAFGAGPTSGPFRGWILLAFHTLSADATATCSI